MNTKNVPDDHPIAPTAKSRQPRTPPAHPSKNACSSKRSTTNDVKQQNQRSDDHRAVPGRTATQPQQIRYLNTAGTQARQQLYTAAQQPPRCVRRVLRAHKPAVNPVFRPYHDQPNTRSRQPTTTRHHSYPNGQQTNPTQEPKPGKKAELGLPTPQCQRRSKSNAKAPRLLLLDGRKTRQRKRPKRKKASNSKRINQPNQQAYISLSTDGKTRIGFKSPGSIFRECIVSPMGL